MRKIIAIDPGPVDSAFVIWDGTKIINKAILANVEMVEFIENHREVCTDLVIEQVECYGMPVGKSIFETVFWTGRFFQKCNFAKHRLPRKEVKLHLCQQVRAKDSNVIQALVDRFTPFEKNKGKGTKKEPGFFYGFKSDIWQAFALAVTWMDQQET